MDKVASAERQRFSWSTLSALTAVFLFSLSANLYQNRVLLRPEDSLYADMKLYVDWAERLAFGGPLFTLDQFYPPGTSYFFSFFFRFFPAQQALVAIAFSSAVLLAASNIILGLTAARLFRLRSLSILVSSAAAFYWPFATLGSFYLSEPLFIFLSLSAQFFFVSGLRRVPAGFLISGVLFALAALVKSQALIHLLACLAAVCCFGGWRTMFRAVLAAPAGAALVLLPFFFRSGHFQPVIAANDAFNLYLGQSRRQAVAALDEGKGEFFVFVNNNSRLDYLYHPPQVCRASIVDRSFFFDKLLQLWREAPRRQVLRSAENLVELFMIEPAWPLNNNPRFREYDLGFQWLGALFFVLPASITIVAGLLFAQQRMETALLFFPLLGISAVAAAGTGQPRYLMPYYYNFLPLALVLFPRLRAARLNPVLRSGLRRQTLYGILCFLSVTGAGVFVAKKYVQTMPLRRDGAQGDYRTLSTVMPPPDSRGKMYWADLGRDGQMVFERRKEPGYSVRLSEFNTAESTARAVPFSVEAVEQGRLELGFNGREVTHVALYMVDPDSFWRSSLLQSGGTRKIAQGLHNGKWISLEISEAERKEGKKEILLTKLLGSSVRVSAVLIYRAISRPGKRSDGEAYLR
jgi:hypothetical protein